MFNQIWWKPDYPEIKFGINPHVTVFETESSQDAKAVETFLRAERIEIFTFGVQLSIHTSKQLNLFEIDVHPRAPYGGGKLGQWQVRPRVIQRAEKLRETLNKKPIIGTK